MYNLNKSRSESSHFLDKNRIILNGQSLKESGLKMSFSFKATFLLLGSLLLSLQLLFANTTEISDGFASPLQTCSSTMTCPAYITVNNSPGQCTALVSFQSPTVQSSCNSTTLVQIAGNSSPSLFSGSNNQITYQLSDDSGQTYECSFNITVTDTETPIIVCPPDITVDNDPGACSALITFIEPTVSDNCPNTQLINNNGYHNPDVIFVGTEEMSYTAQDDDGNTATCSYDITVIDTEPAEIICPGLLNVTAPVGQCFAQVTYIVLTTNDNCGRNSIYLTDGMPSGSIFPVGFTQVCYETEDGSKNHMQCCFTVEVVDPRTITINCPPDPVIQADPGSCGAIATYEVPFMSESCYRSTVEQASGSTSGQVMPVGTNTICYTIQAGNGASLECCFDIIIEDEEPPGITCPSSITATTIPDQCGAIVSFAGPTIYDNCSGASHSVASGFPSGSRFDRGHHSIEYLATDFNGNAATCTFDIDIVDDESPTITCPPNIILESDPSACSALATYESPLIGDNCSALPPRATAGLPSGSAFPEGLTQICFETEDPSGNVANCCFLILVMDRELPIISCPPDRTVNTDPTGCMKEIVDIPLAVTADNCSVASKVNSHTLSDNPNGVYPYGTTVVEYVVYDVAQNSANCFFSIQVNDGTPPSITCPANTTIPNLSRSCLGQINYQIQCFDHCDANIVPQKMSGPPNLSVLSLGTYLVEYSASDITGNKSTCEFNFTIEDMEAPEILSCPSNMTINSNIRINPCGNAVTWMPPIAFDFCGSVNVSSNFNSGVFMEGGNRRYVEYTFTDGEGNSSTCEFNAYMTSCSYQPLPVDWIHLSGETAGANNFLKWQVLGEKEVDRYELLRSKDSKEFVSIGEISILSNFDNSYSFTDLAPLADAYYKVVAIDHDGSENYSNTIHLERNLKTFFKAIPNPTNGLLQLEFSTDAIGDYEVQIYNATGSLVYSRSAATSGSRSSLNVDLGPYADGIYLARLSMNGEFRTLRILKN